MLDQHEQLGADAGDLAAQLGADGAPGARDQHRVASQVGAHTIDLHSHGVAPEHVLHPHLAHLAHEVDPTREQLEGGGQRAHGDAPLPARGDHLLAHGARGRGDRDDHLGGAHAVEDPGQLRRGAQDLVAGHAHALLARVVVHEAHRCASQAGIAAQLERHLLATVARAHDQHLAVGSLEDRAARRALHQCPHGKARSGREHQSQQEVEDDHGPRGVHAADREQVEHSQQRDGGHHHPPEDGLEVALIDEAPQLRVEAEQREDDELDGHDEEQRVPEQPVVPGRDALVEAQHVGQVVGEREQAGVDGDLAEPARVDR